MAIPLLELMSALPLILQTVQIIGYVFLVLFFGSIAIKGWRGCLHFIISLLFRIAIGFVCLISGLAIGPLIPVLQTGIWKMFQADLLVGGFISSIVLAIALYMISFRLPSVFASIRNKIQKLQAKLEKMEKTKAKRLDPFRMIGIVIIVAIIIFGVVSFRGFPNMATELFSSLGELGMGEMGLGPGVAEMSMECLTAVTTMGIITQNHPELLANPPEYKGETLKAKIEEGSGSKVVAMYKIDYEGNVVIATIMEGEQRCFATETKFCFCQ